MRRITPALVMLLTACPGDDGPTDGNPEVLWLGLDGSEVEVKLIPSEPPPF